MPKIMPGAETIKKVIQELVVPDLKNIVSEIKDIKSDIKELKVEIKRLDQKIDSLRNEVMTEIKRLDEKIDSTRRELNEKIDTALDIRERLARVESKVGIPIIHNGSAKYTTK